MEQVLWNHGKTLTFNLEDALYTQASESLMWGGLYGLSQSKIKGRWNPYIYNDQKGYTLERNTWKKTVQYFWELPSEPENYHDYVNEDGTLKTTVIIDGVEKTKNLVDNVDYIRIYIPCEEDMGYAYIKSEEGELKYGELTEGIKLTRNNRDVLIWYPEQNEKQSINIYDRDYFANELLNNMESCELQINNFEAFENNMIKAEEYEENEEIEIPLHDIHEYKWKNCNVSLLSSERCFNNIVTMDNVDISYQTIDFNSNKRFLFYSDIDKRWDSYKFLSTKVSIRLTNIDGDEGILTSSIPLGIFYIVEDENLVTPMESNFINPIETAVQNRKIMENIIPLVADKKFAIDIDKNIKSFNYSQLPEYNKTALTVFYNPDTMKPYEPNEYYLEDNKGERIFGNYKIFNIGEKYLKWVRRIADYGTAIGQTVNLNRSNFPYNFKLVGETYIRDRYSEDSHYQIELYNCAILDSISCTT